MVIEFGLRRSIGLYILSRMWYLMKNSMVNPIVKSIVAPNIVSVEVQVE